MTSRISKTLLFMGSIIVFTGLAGGGVAIAATTISTDITTGGTLTVGSLSGLLLGTNGVVSAISSSTLNLTFSNILGTLGISQGGTGATSFGQGWIFSNGGTGALSASTSPTVNYITATSTTATSTFANGIGLSHGCFSINGTCLSSGSGSGIPGGASSTIEYNANGVFAGASHLTYDGATTTISGLVLSNGSAVYYGNSLLIDSSGNLDAAVANLCDTSSNLASVIPSLGQIVCETDTGYWKGGTGTALTLNIKPLNPFLFNGQNMYYTNSAASTTVSIGTSTPGGTFTIKGSNYFAAGIAPTVLGSDIFRVEKSDNSLALGVNNNGDTLVYGTLLLAGSSVPHGIEINDGDITLDYPGNIVSNGASGATGFYLDSTEGTENIQTTIADSLVYSIDVSGFPAYIGAKPSVASCGTNPSVTGADVAGVITAGSGSITACTLTYATSHAPPTGTMIMCQVTQQTGTPVAIAASTTASGFVLTGASNITSDRFSYFCAFAHN